jgi:OOP family OmpA-OmpF porin
MGNVLYEFLPGRTITPYVGAGVGVDFGDGVSNSASTVFAYQALDGGQKRCAMPT